MILAIRISGQVDLTQDVKEALFRLRLRRKYAAVLLADNAQNRKTLQKLRNYLAYGTINKEALEKLVSLRGQSIDKTKKVDANAVVGKIGSAKMEELGLKPFFRLHPPRGGIDSKKHFGVGKGVLGDNKEKINDLVMRML